MTIIVAGFIDLENAGNLCNSTIEVDISQICNSNALKSLFSSVLYVANEMNSLDTGSFYMTSSALYCLTNSSTIKPSILSLVLNQIVKTEKEKR